jgi:hypothetical protein
MSIEVVKDRRQLAKEDAEAKVSWALALSKDLVSEHNLQVEASDNENVTAILTVASLLLEQVK